MARMWIVVGDTTTGGGSVVSGSPFTSVHGKAVARVGDAVACARHGATTIVSGDPTLAIDGQAVAREGDACACGCTLLSIGQASAFIDSGAASGAAAGGATQAASALAGSGSGAGGLASAAAFAAATPAATAGHEGEDGEDEEAAPSLEAVELAPAIQDEDGQEVEGSTTPEAIPHRHPMVEVEPRTRRIAHREVRVRVRTEGEPDDAHAGKRLTWTMAPLFEPPDGGDAAFRGDWAQAGEGHRDRFAAATEFDASGFARVSQESATTTVGADGHSAIRVNLPPVGFNAARVSVQLEGEEAVELIDFEVPAVVVLDAGHGGDSDLPSSSANNATSHTSGILEKELTLDFARRTRDALHAARDADDLNLRVLMTRDSDDNVAGAARANVARDNGADILLSIHFNGFDRRARGTETLIRPAASNVNHAQDTALATRVNDAVYAAILAHDENANDRGIKEQNLAALSDTSLGNSADYHPVRSALLEVEFIDNEDVDRLLSIDEGHETVRQDICDALAAALLEDLRANP